MSDEKTKSMALSRTEQIMFKGIQAREREVEEKILMPLRSDLREVLDIIHVRLGLPPGSIGTTHALDVESWTVTLNPSNEEDGGDRDNWSPKSPPPPGDSGENVLLEERDLEVLSNGTPNKSRSHR